MAYTFNEGPGFFSIDVPQPEAQQLRDVLAAHRDVTVAEKKLLFGVFVSFRMSGEPAPLQAAKGAVDAWADDRHAGEIW